MTIKEALPMINTGIIAFFMVLFGLQYNQNKNLNKQVTNLTNELNDQVTSLTNELNGKGPALSEKERDLIDCLKHEDCFAYEVDGKKLNRNSLDYYMNHYSFTKADNGNNKGLNDVLQTVHPLNDGYKYEYNNDIDNKSLYIRDKIHFRRGGINAVADKFVIKDSEDNIVDNSRFNEIKKQLKD